MRAASNSSSLASRSLRVAGSMPRSRRVPGLAEEAVVVELDAGVEGYPAAIGRAREGVDLGEQQVPLREEPPEAREDAR